MIARVLRFCRGYVALRAEGAALERLVNLCRVNGVALWAVERIDETAMTFCMSKGDWLWLEPLCSRTLCTVTLRGRYGLGRVLAPFRMRKALLGTAALCILLVMLSGQLLWQVRIEGCSRIPQRELYDRLRSLGLTPGRPLAALDLPSIRGRIMTARDDLSYLTINLRGTCALVTVTEKDPDRTAKGPLTPCDIYADRAGIVEAMTVREGEPCVQVGDTVIPGDLLVSGRLVSTQGEERLVPADADITLRTWPSAAVALHPGQYGYAETGRVFTRWSLQLGSRRFALPHIEKIGDACYYKTMETTAVSLGEGYLFPLTLIRERWHECTVFRPALSEAGCRALLHDTCHSLLEADAIEGSLQEQAFTMIFEPDRIVARLQAEGLEKTGEKTPITGEH